MRSRDLLFPQTRKHLHNTFDEVEPRTDMECAHTFSAFAPPSVTPFSGTDFLRPQEPESLMLKAGTIRVPAENAPPVGPACYLTKWSRPPLPGDRAFDLPN